MKPWMHAERLLLHHRERVEAFQRLWLQNGTRSRLILLPLSQLIYDNSRFLKWKDCQRYALQLTVLWFRLVCLSKKDRQKDRQLIRLLTAETGQCLTNSFFNSISYEIAGEELTMYGRSSSMPYKPLN